MVRRPPRQTMILRPSTWSSSPFWSRPSPCAEVCGSSAPRRVTGSAGTSRRRRHFLRTAVPRTLAVRSGPAETSRGHRRRTRRAKGSAATRDADGSGRRADSTRRAAAATAKLPEHFAVSPLASDGGGRRSFVGTNFFGFVIDYARSKSVVACKSFVAYTGACEVVENCSTTDSISRSSRLNYYNFFFRRSVHFYAITVNRIIYSYQKFKMFNKN